jgi:serine/threonine protein kinase
MQLLQGKSLDAYLMGGKKLSAGQVCRIGREAALGLAAAHAKGLIHRDIKPANLWLEAPKGRVKILDFGLARPADDAHLTGTGMALGTPAYMAPEQARGQALDGRCDLWSLSVVLYRLCADRLPFQGGDMLSIFTAIAVDEPQPLASLNPEVPPALAELVH